MSRPSSTPSTRELAGLAGESHRDDCLREASDLVSALLDTDGRLSDAELRAWLDDVGSLLTPPVIVTPQRLREGEMLTGRAAWLDRPSTLFDLLLKADARDGERRANRYYDVALKLAHADGRDRPRAVARRDRRDRSLPLDAAAGDGRHRRSRAPASRRPAAAAGSPSGRQPA